ncbi:Nop25 domain-containing protein [Cephalotus follicularis]|uniref:Nop25 domain-containing protein n=1 Tax=Cephalotus follicularis TaxID=3775 RepID=A0A1Q3ATG0_CEPFO|nr:Nop25 domain-containing protein [Cephalotus follicularis]
MIGDVEEEVAQQHPSTRVRHINKRALKNKALSVSFNEKDLKDYVGGFHKRKKKRRKEAEKKQEEALRRKRIELRKKRKLEKELALCGGVPPAADTAPDEATDCEDDEKGEPTASVAGTTMYENGNLQVTVTTSEISREEDTLPCEKIHAPVPRSIGADKSHNVPVSKTKLLKKIVKHKSLPKPLSKRDKRKMKNKNKTRR